MSWNDIKRMPSIMKLNRTEPRKIDKPLVLYGKGKLGHLAKEIFNRLEIPVVSWIDNQSSIVTDDYRRFPEFLVANAVALYPPKEINAYLHKCGFIDIVPVWDIIEAYPECGIRNGWFATHWDEYICARLLIADNLYDEESKQAYRDFCNYRYFRKEYDTVSKRENTDYQCLSSTLADVIARKSYDPFQINDLPYSSIRRDNVTLHCEGNEMGLLFFHIDKILRERPSLKVACYHNEDGLIRIPKFLMDRLDGYRFEFKLYAYQGQAAFLYAYPEEKL